MEREEANTILENGKIAARLNSEQNQLGGKEERKRAPRTHLSYF